MIDWCMCFLGWRFKKCPIMHEFKILLHQMLAMACLDRKFIYWPVVAAL